MAVTSHWYLNGVYHMCTGGINWASDSIKGALVTSAYTPNQATHTNWNDVSANEVTGTGYTAGGMVIGTRSVTTDSTSEETRFLGDDLTWTASTLTARYCVIYDDTPASPSKWLIGYIDFGSDQSSVASSFPITFSGRKVLRIVAN